MNPIAHAELSWLVLAQPLGSRRDRALVTWAGVLPDLDGLTILSYPLDHGTAYTTYHHLLTHSALAAAGVGIGCAALATRGARLATATLALLAFHVHLLCDLLGSGHAWPIAYTYPFSETWTMPFSFGWELNGWQNQLIGLLASLAVLAVGVRKGRTIFELFSARGDAVVCATLRKWAGRRG